MAITSANQHRHSGRSLRRPGIQARIETVGRKPAKVETKRESANDFSIKPFNKKKDAMHSFSKASCAAKPFRLLIWTVSEIIVAAACLLCLFPPFSTGPRAGVCRDCCLVSGAYDGRDGSGIFYKDAGGLRQKQWMISSVIGCVGGCFGSLEYDDVLYMLDDCLDVNYTYYQQTGKADPCLALPGVHGGQDRRFGTAYGNVYECPGGLGYGGMAYKLEKLVECADPGRDTDADGVPDCEDNCPFVHNPPDPEDGVQSGDACGDCPDCSMPMRIDKNPVKPGETAAISADFSLSPCPRDLAWSVSRYDGTAGAIISGSASGRTAILSDVRGKAG